MKKLLSLLLSLAMLCALAMPALAYDPADDLEPPLWEQFGYESYEDMTGDGSYWTEEEYAEMVAAKREWEAKAAAEQAAFDAWKAEYIAAHPEEVAAFDPDSYFTTHQYYIFWDSPEEYIETTGMTREEFETQMRSSWFSRLYENAQAQAARDAYLAEQGGTPGQFNLMVDGRFLSFPAEKPMYLDKDGFLYADAETLSAALGIDIPAPLDGYVQLRSAAAKAGYEVLWDGDYLTAVLIDPQAAADLIDQDFTILNRALAALTLDPEKTYRSTGRVNMDLTAFNSIDGDEHYSIRGDVKALQSPDGLELSGSVDMADYVSALMDSFLELSSYLEEDVPPQAAALLDALSGFTYELRADLENGTVYLRCPLLSTLASFSGVDLPADAWVSFSLGNDLDLDQDAAFGSLTVGALVLAMDSSAGSPIFYYDDYLAAGEALAQVMGDSRFTARGADRQLTLDVEDLIQLAYGDEWYEDDCGFSEYDSLPQEFSLTLTVKANGAVEGSFAYRTPKYSYSSSPDSDTRVTAQWSFSASRRNVTVEVHSRNTAKLTLTMTEDISVTTARPSLTPPDGAVVIPAEELGA